MKSVYIKIFRDRNCFLVAACDSELIGKTFREGKLKLEVARDFYGGTLASLEETVKILNKADVANLVGSCIVDASIKEGLVSADAVITIAGVPHVQIMKF